MSGIDYAHLRSLTARQIVNALQRDGFSLNRQSGSHRLYRHPDGRRGVRGINAAHEFIRGYKEQGQHGNRFIGLSPELLNH